MKRFENCTTIINGHSYTAQFNGTREYPKGLDAMNDRTTGLRSNEKMVDYLLNNVLAEPSDFDMDSVTPDELDELIGFLFDIFRGRNEKYVKRTKDEKTEEKKTTAKKQAVE